jgi:hypothetical protein
MLTEKQRAAGMRLPKDFTMTIRGESISVTGTAQFQDEAEGLMLAIALMTETLPVRAILEERNGTE